MLSALFLLHRRRSLALTEVECAVTLCPVAQTGGSIMTAVSEVPDGTYKYRLRDQQWARNTIPVAQCCVGQRLRIGDHAFSVEGIKRIRQDEYEVQFVGAREPLFLIELDAWRGLVTEQALGLNADGILHL